MNSVPFYTLILATECSEGCFSVVRWVRQGCRRVGQWLRHLGLSSAPMSSWHFMESWNGWGWKGPPGQLVWALPLWHLLVHLKKQMFRLTDSSGSWTPCSLVLCSSYLKYETMSVHCSCGFKVCSQTRCITMWVRKTPFPLINENIF